jgi:hypothetical protein
VGWGDAGAGAGGGGGGAVGGGGGGEGGRRRDFPHLSRPALGLTQLLVQWVLGLPGGKEWPGHNAESSLPSNAVGHERIELYLYSRYGP